MMVVLGCGVVRHGGRAPAGYAPGHRGARLGSIGSPRSWACLDAAGGLNERAIIIPADVCPAPGEHPRSG